MSTITPERESSKPAIPVPAEREPAMLFKYSTWVHVGVGAERCEEVNEAEGHNGCGDRSHFHAWCRLPNPLQQAEIRDRALAARARKIRQLRDPITDGYAILQEEFEALAREGDPAREKLIEELLALDFWRDYYATVQEVRQIEDEAAPVEEGEDPPRLYAHIEDDQARLLRLDGMPEDQRPADEHAELKRHLAAYQAAIDAALNARVEPKRAALAALPIDTLLEQGRDKRIENEAQAEFRRVFEVHEWLACTYRQPDGPPALTDLAVLERAAPEIVDALQSTFADLKRTAQEAQGN